VIPSFERRLRQQRSRVAIRSWDYRQRRHARGVWYKLRRTLVDAQTYFVPAARLAQIASSRPLPVRLEAELLRAECLALTAFETLVIGD